MSKKMIIMLSLAICICTLGCVSSSQVMDETVPINTIQSTAQTPEQHKNTPVPNSMLAPTVEPTVDETILVEEQQIELVYNEKEYQGTYGGELLNGLPNGMGKFSAIKEDEYLQYSGEWTNGLFSGSGYVKTNNFIVKMKTTDRHGEYEGEVLDGIPSGNGTFSAVNDLNEAYTYVGEWDSGMFNGQGTITYEYRAFSGTFIDGEFCPTPYEIFRFAGEPDDGWYGFTIQDKSREFLIDHSNLFTQNSEDGLGAFVDTTFSYRAYAKSPDLYGDQLIRQAKLHVAQIKEFDTFQNIRATEIIAVDTNENVYYVYYLGTVANVYVNDSITMYALPLDFFAYETTERIDMPAVVCAAAYIKG